MKRVRWRIFLLSAVLVFAGLSTADAATDPLGGNYTVFGKDRVAATVVSGNGGFFYSVTDSNASVSAAQQMGSGITWDQSIAEVASAGGFIVADPDAPAADDFYGAILPAGRTGVVASAYLVNTSTSGEYDIYFTLADKDGSLLNPANAFILEEGVRVSTTSKSCSYFSLVANDWNDDGYSDYILTYPTFVEGTSIDPFTPGQMPLVSVVSVYVDGQACFNSARNNPSSNPFIEAEECTLFGEVDSSGNRDVNVSTAVGDVDGDGSKEFIAYYSNNTVGGHTIYDNILDGYN
ncbi:MAG: hypothetical protein LBQ42_06535, partial [Synergistaceae bacterium]|nr:hypothetical protein [Synergistaceae bacterium]